MARCVARMRGHAVCRGGPWDGVYVCGCVPFARFRLAPIFPLLHKLLEELRVEELRVLCSFCCGRPCNPCKHQFQL